MGAQKKIINACFQFLCGMFNSLRSINGYLRPVMRKKGKTVID